MFLDDSEDDYVCDLDHYIFLKPYPDYSRRFYKAKLEEEKRLKQSREYSYKPTYNRLVKDITNLSEDEKAKSFSFLNEIFLELFEETKENEDSLLTKITPLFQDDSRYYKLFMGIFNVHYSTRPKERKILINLITSLYSKCPHFKTNFDESFSTYDRYNCDLLTFFIHQNPDIKNDITNNIKQSAFLLYKGPITTAIINDDFDTLQSLTYDETKFNFKNAIKTVHEHLDIKSICSRYKSIYYEKK